MERRPALPGSAAAGHAGGGPLAIRRNDTGTLVYSNLEGAASLDESVHAVEQEELSLTQNGAAREQDYVVWNGKEQYYLLYIALPDAAGTKQLVTPEDAGLAAQYGYTFDGYTWNYDEQMDSRVTTSVLARHVLDAAAKSADISL